MKTDKAEQREAIRERARRALRSLYHNATPDFPRDLRGRSEDYAQQWFDDAARCEVEYMQDGGAYGSNYRKTLAADCNAGKYKSERARAFYINKGMRKMEEERADCGMLTGWRALEFATMEHGGRVGGVVRARLLAMRRKYPDASRNDSQWERISEYGKLYQYGRGGRTLAPSDLVKLGGGSSFSIREDYADELPITAVVELIRVVESFNRAVTQWCSRENLEFMWAEHCQVEDDEKRAERKRARQKARDDAQRAAVRQCFI